MHDPLEEIVEEFMEGQTRARDLDAMIEALSARRDAMARDLEAARESDRNSLAARVAEANRQIRALREERAITGFVEDSVRSAALNPRPNLGEFDEFDEFDE